MKTNLELQRERDIEARKRLAMPSLDWSQYVASKPSPLEPGAECCGAPREAIPTSAYYKRHLYGGAGYPISPPCDQSKLCSSLQRNENRGGKLRPPIDPNGAPCCGAPSEPEPTGKYYQRHYTGVRGFRVGPACAPAKACIALYNRGERSETTSPAS